MRKERDVIIIIIISEIDKIFSIQIKVFMLPLWGFALIYNFNNFFVYIFCNDSQIHNF